MSLYDVIDEISGLQTTKTETGDERVYGVMVGLVAKNYHQDMGGRLCVTIPTRDEKANELQWARLSMPSSGKKWGHYFLPEVGDQVLLAFEGGNIERPYVIGCVPKDNNPFLRDSVDRDNQTKRIVTKHGSTITFEDNRSDEDGGRDKITVQTAGKAHTILLDNENQKIRISDKEGANFMELTTRENQGCLKIKVESQITIEVGDSVKVTMSGETGSVKIEARQVTIQASQKAVVKTDGMLTLEGAQITEKATSVCKVESGGIINLSGSPIKIG